jgi:hypothetical protein
VIFGTQVAGEAGFTNASLPGFPLVKSLKPQSPVAACIFFKRLTSLHDYTGDEIGDSADVFCLSQAAGVSSAV